MTLRVYWIDHDNTSNSDFVNYDWQDEIRDLHTLDPDVVIITCMQEFDIGHIFRNLLKGVNDWCGHKNKTAHLIAPSKIHLPYRDIIVEDSVGYILWMVDIDQYIKHSPDSHKNTTKLFTCYNNVPKLHRLKIVDALAGENLLGNGVVTCNTSTLAPGHFKWQHHDGSRLYDEPDFNLHHGYIPNDIPRSFFEGFFDIVTESSEIPDMYFMTEKTMKSIANLKPFLVLNICGYHTKYLRDRFGLELYDEMFDYSFDIAESLDDRVNGIIENTKRLQDILSTEQSRLDMYERILPKLNRNRETIKTIMSTPEKLVPESLKFMLNRTDYELLGKCLPRIRILSHMHMMNWIAK